MRPATVRLAGVAFVLLAAGSPGLPQGKAETWGSSELGLRITPPRGWTTVANTPLEAVMSPPVGRAKVAVFGLPAGGAGEDEPPDIDHVADGAIDSLRTSFRKFKLLGRRTMEVAGLPAREIYFRGRVEGEKFRFVQTILLHRDYQVIVMYMAPEEVYTRLLGDYDQLVRSVRALPRN